MSSSAVHFSTRTSTQRRPQHHTIILRIAAMMQRWSTLQEQNKLRSRTIMDQDSIR